MTWLVSYRAGIWTKALEDLLLFPRHVAHKLQCAHCLSRNTRAPLPLPLPSLSVCLPPTPISCQKSFLKSVLWNPRWAFSASEDTSWRVWRREGEAERLERQWGATGDELLHKMSPPCVLSQLTVSPWPVFAEFASRLEDAFSRHVFFILLHHACLL